MLGTFLGHESLNRKSSLEPLNRTSKVTLKPATALPSLCLSGGQLDLLLWVNTYSMLPAS